MININKTLEQIKERKWFPKRRWWFTENCVASFFESIKLFKTIESKNINCPKNLKLPKSHFTDEIINKENITAFFISFKESLELFDELNERNDAFKEDWLNKQEKLVADLAKRHGCPESKIKARQDYIADLDKQVDELVNKKIELVDSIIKMDQFLKNKQ